MSQAKNRELHRTTRRAFVHEVGAGLTGGLMLRALPWVAGTGALLWPRRAEAATILDPQNPSNFARDGQQSATPGSILTLSDTSSSDCIAFFANDGDAGAAHEVDVVATFQVIQTAPNNADAGNRVVINDGISRSAIASCVVINGVRGMGLLSTGLPSDPGSYPVFVPVDWEAAPITIRLRRYANGDAEIVEVNGVTPSPRALLTANMAPLKTRAGPTVEFGTGSPDTAAGFSFGAPEPECTVEYYAFRSERAVQPVAGALGFTRFRIRDTDSADRLAFRADFQLGAASNGFDPTTEPVAIQLSTPGCCVFYAQTLNGFTVRGKAPRRRWVLTDAERQRTGIEQLVIDEDPGNAGAIVLRDARTELFDDYFGTVNAVISIGAGALGDVLSGTARLEERRAGRGHWRLHREP